MRTKLTKRAVDSIASSSADILVWDTELKGFGLKVTPKDKRVFVVQYWAPNARLLKRRVTLGSFGPLTVDQARDMARALLGRVAAGEDPAADASKKRVAGRDSTVAVLSEAYLEEVEAKLKPTTSYEYKRIFRVYVNPAIGKKAVNAVEFKDISAIHLAHKDHPIQANRVLARLTGFMYWTELHGYRPKGTNPCVDVTEFKEHSSERFLTVEETGRLGNALLTAERTGLPPAPQQRKKPKSDETAKHRPKSADTPKKANPFAVAAIRFLLLSGWRENEALTLQRSMVDFDRGMATLEDSKTGRSHRPLGKPALKLLKSLPRIDESPYFFPGKKPQKPLREIKRVWFAARFAAGLADVRLHDLRHTVASFSVAGGHSLFITGKLLGHRRAETTQRYAHLLDDARLLTADSVSASIASALERGTKKKRSSRQ